MAIVNTDPISAEMTANGIGARASVPRPISPTNDRNSASDYCSSPPRRFLDHGDRPTCVILSLSTELIVEIAEYAALSPKVLLNLRLTCKDLHARTQEVVAKMYFRDRAFLIKHPGSLSTLYEISRHSVFGRSMQHVRFSLATWYNLCYLHHLCYLKRDEADPDTVTTMQPRRGRDEVWKMMADFHKSDYALALVRETLINFREKGTILTISLIDDDIKGDEWGYHQLRRALGYEPCMVADRDDALNARPYAVLLRAIEGAGYPINHLEIGANSHGIRPSLLGCDVKYGPLQYEPYRHLRSLRLHTGYDRRSYATSAHPSLSQFFAQLANVEHLALTFKVYPYRYAGGDDNDWIVHALAEAARNHDLKRLKSLELAGYWMTFDNLRDIVFHTSSTLESLEIRMLRSVAKFPVGFERILRQAHGGRSFEVTAQVYPDQEHLR